MSKEIEIRTFMEFNANGTLRGERRYVSKDDYDALEERVEALEPIVEVAARLDMLIVSDGGDVAATCETQDELHEALKPWRAAQCAAALKPNG